MDFLGNLPQDSLRAVLVVIFLAFAGVAVVNVYATLWVWARIGLNVALLALPFLAVAVLSDAAGWAKVGLPERFVYLTSLMEDDRVFILARDVLIDEEGYDVGAAAPRLYLVINPSEELLEGLETAEDMQRGQAVFGPRDEADGGASWGLPLGEYEISGWNLPPKQ